MQTVKWKYTQKSYPFSLFMDSAGKKYKKGHKRNQEMSFDLLTTFRLR